MKLDYRLVLVAVITVFGNAYVQYLVNNVINWTNAVLVGLVVTALIPLFYRKKK